jgi:hypothetical protein
MPWQASRPPALATTAITGYHTGAKRFRNSPLKVEDVDEARRQLAAAG